VRTVLYYVARFLEQIIFVMICELV